MPETFEILAVTGTLMLKTALDAAARSRVLAFIDERFQACFGAEVEDDSPTLIGGFDCDGALVAAFGLRDSEQRFLLRALSRRAAGDRRCSARSTTR